jgi:nucleoside-diphosphate-sugar epimerase
MLESTIGAARASGARILFPGTVYNFGPGAFPCADEAAPQHPLTRKGALRVAMEQRLHQAAGEGVRSLIVRAGDFFGAHAPNSWFGQGLVKAGSPLRAIRYPGPRALEHAWAYLPDLAETMLQLLERRDELGDVETFHFAGHCVTGDAMIAAIRRAAAAPGLPVRRFPWPVLYLAAPFIETFREMLEMRYLWRQPLALDNRKLAGFLGAEPHTPLDAAVAASLAGLGSIGAAASRPARPPMGSPRRVSPGRVRP